MSKSKDSFEDRRIDRWLYLKGLWLEPVPVVFHKQQFILWKYSKRGEWKFGQIKSIIDNKFKNWRLALRKTGQYSGMLDAARKIYAGEGERILDKDSFSLKPEGSRAQDTPTRRTMKKISWLLSFRAPHTWSNLSSVVFLNP